MEDNRHNVDDIEAGFGIFDNPEIQKRREARNMEDTKKFAYAQINEALTRSGGVYPKNKTVPVESAKKIASKSIGNKKVTNKKTKKVVSDERAKDIDVNKIIQKTAIILSTILILVSLGVFTNLAFGENIENNIRQREEIDRLNERIKAIFSQKAFLNLVQNGLAEIDSKGNITIKNNSVSDYYKLNINHKYDIYGYSLILEPVEFNKFIQTVSYNDGLYNYISMEQFLTYNGYINPKTNKLDMNVFRNLIEASIRDNMPEGNLDRFELEGNVLTYEEFAEIIRQEIFGNGFGGK